MTQFKAIIDFHESLPRKYETPEALSDTLRALDSRNVNAHVTVLNYGPCVDAISNTHKVTKTSSGAKWVDVKATHSSISDKSSYITFVGSPNTRIRGIDHYRSHSHNDILEGDRAMLDTIGNYSDFYMLSAGARESITIKLGIPGAALEIISVAVNRVKKYLNLEVDLRANKHSGISRAFEKYSSDIKEEKSDAGMHFLEELDKQNVFVRKYDGLFGDLELINS